MTEWAIIGHFHNTLNDSIFLLQNQSDIAT